MNMTRAAEFYNNNIKIDWERAKILKPTSNLIDGFLQERIEILRIKPQNNILNNRIAENLSSSWIFVLRR